MGTVSFDMCNPYRLNTKQKSTMSLTLKSHTLFLIPFSSTKTRCQMDLIHPGAVTTQGYITVSAAIRNVLKIALRTFKVYILKFPADT